jgi:hypothetical protein
MKRDSKSAPFCKGRLFLSAAALGLLLSACSLPPWFTGEPDASVLDAPRPVGDPANKGASVYPLLSSVPNEKPAFSTSRDRADAIEALARANAEGQALDEAASPEDVSKPQQ